MPLTKKEIASFREVLMDKREALLGQVKNLAADAASSTESTENSKAPQDEAENASDVYEQDFAFITMESEEELLHKVESALRRIREGSYGTCDECNTSIPKARLEALPFADLCVKCQELEEQGLLAGDDDEAFDADDDDSSREEDRDDDEQEEDEAE